MERQSSVRKRCEPVFEMAHQGVWSSEIIRIINPWRFFQTTSNYPRAIHGSWVPSFSIDLHPEYQMATHRFDAKGTSPAFNDFTVSDANDTQPWSQWTFARYLSHINTTEFGLLTEKASNP